MAEGEAVAAGLINDCEDFKAGTCEDDDCKLYHAYRYCRDYQNNKICNRERCKFMHVLKNDVARYKATGHRTAKMLYEAKRTKQTANICRLFLYSGVCQRYGCPYSHEQVAAEDYVTCPICYDPAEIGIFLIFENCPHGFCSNCAPGITDYDAYPETLYKCPLCRNKGPARVAMLSSRTVIPMMCRDFLVDRCHRKNCKYAHKFKFCRSYRETGNCERGRQCKYLHVLSQQEVLPACMTSERQRVYSVTGGTGIRKPKCRFEKEGGECMSWNCPGCEVPHLRCNRCNVILKTGNISRTNCFHLYCGQCRTDKLSDSDHVCEACGATSITWHMLAV